ncbi:MAG: GuaB3 family IMP dehydrogenase-related protein [Microthrixaceae bacterium]|nr:GuaB3 family IMP dehydrogenase-related protein [Microthrixaceae bacterium]
MTSVDIGLGKSARRGYSLDEVAIVPSRRTRAAHEVDLSWQIDAYQFDTPVISSPTDGVTSPEVAIAMDRLGGLGVLHAEGLWTRYEDPLPVLERISALEPGDRTAELREAYSAPVDPDLIGVRVRQIRDGGAVAAVAVSPARTEALLPHITAAEPHMLVIKGTVTSAEHVSTTEESPLDLKYLVRRLDVPVIVGGCASYQAALHLMRTGAAGVLVGVGQGVTSRTADVLGVHNPQATAIADARAARMRHLDETGIHCHVIADGGMRTGGDIAKAIVCGADAVMLAAPLAAAEEAPAHGALWSNSAFHPELPRGVLARYATAGRLEAILEGPADSVDGRCNLLGALRKAMAVCGYENLKDLQKAELVATAPREIR